MNPKSRREFLKSSLGTVALAGSARRRLPSRQAKTKGAGRRWPKTALKSRLREHGV